RSRAMAKGAFEVAAATVAGYQMVALAAGVLAAGLEALGEGAGGELAPAQRQAVALELFRAAGAGGMIGGQALDLEAEGRGPGVPAPDLEDLHRRKTGALIAAACVIGGLAAGAPPAACEAVRGYGADVGLAFQVYDDVLDATGTSAQLGKTAGKDAARAKATFVTLGGVGAAGVTGGPAAGAPPAPREAWRGYGADVGLASRVSDDVLAAPGTPAQLGKTAGKDAARAKATFVTRGGGGAARAEAERLAARGVDRLRQAGLVSPTLAELAHYIVTRPN